MKNILAAIHQYVFTAIGLLTLFVGASSSVQAVTTYNDVWATKPAKVRHISWRLGLLKQASRKTIIRLL
jgi:hypothetical protein